MKLSKALRQDPEGRNAYLKDFVRRISLSRYGYKGDIDDHAALAAWLETAPLIDVDYVPPSTTPTPIRPEQAKFRQELLDAYGRRCAISGSLVSQVLDAAHLRPWTEASGVGDGILLRADLHRLLDAGLLQFNRDYTVSVARESAVWEDYGQYDGVKIRLPKRRKDWPRV